METVKKLAFAIKFTYHLAAYTFFLILERTIWKNRYIGYYDWPSRSWEEYVAQRDEYYNQHQDNLNAR